MRKWNRKARKDGVRRSVFVNSLSDFFDNEVPQAWRDFAFRIFAECDWLDIDLLTKRPGLVMKMVPPTWLAGFPPNIRLGISVCNQAEYDRDVDKLIEIPARVRYLSLEPLLGPIHLGFTCTPVLWTITHTSEFDEHEPTERSWKIHWVIAGGESGHNARPAHPQWFRDIRDQCAAVRVPFHFKQHGEWVSTSEVAGPGAHHQFEDGATVRRVGTKLAGRTLDGAEHLAFPLHTESLAAR
jgi:protein gp37